MQRVWVGYARRVEKDRSRRPAGRQGPRRPRALHIGRSPPVRQAPVRLACVKKLCITTIRRCAVNAGI
eukprot:4693058-Prymnesium_polylepis.1